MKQTNKQTNQNAHFVIRTQTCKREGVGRHKPKYKSKTKMRRILILEVGRSVVVNFLTDSYFVHRMSGWMDGLNSKAHP